MQVRLRRKSRGSAVGFVWLIALAACSNSAEPEAAAEPPTSSPETTVTSVQAPEQLQTSATSRPSTAKQEACTAWRAVRHDVVEVADSGREPQRTQLLRAIELLRKSQEPETTEEIDGGDLESLDYWFDPISEYVAFHNDPEATSDPRYVGDRDAVLEAVGVFDQICNNGMN